MSEERWATFWLVVVVCLMAMAWTCAHAQHRPQDMPIHEMFYSTWMMPSNRNISCCSKQDCRPAASKLVDGRWYAKPEGEEDWLAIPDAAIERDRDTPDGRSHVCYRRWQGFGVNYVIYCFIAGVGG